MRGLISSIGAALSGRFKLTAVLAFLLVFAVSTDAAHSHDSDSGKQFDCEICLKHGQEDDFVASAAVVSITPPTDKLFVRVAPVPLSVEIPQPRSRSPPSF